MKRILKVAITLSLTIIPVLYNADSIVDWATDNMSSQTKKDAFFSLESLQRPVKNDKKNDDSKGDDVAENKKEDLSPIPRHGLKKNGSSKKSKEKEKVTIPASNVHEVQHHTQETITTKESNQINASPISPAPPASPMTKEETKILSSKVLLSREPQLDTLHHWSQWLHARTFREGVPREKNSLNFIDEDHGTKSYYDGYIYTPPKLITELEERKHRFPSVQQRIEYYMGKWYNYNSSSPFDKPEFHEKKQLIENISDRKNFTGVFASPLLNPFDLDPQSLWNFCKDFWKPSKDQDKRLTQLYIRDMIDLAILHRNQTAPIFIRLGDGSSVVTDVIDRSYPVFAKIRDVIADGDHDSRRSDHARCDFVKQCWKCGCGTMHSTILWPLNRGRNYKHPAMLPLYDVPWEKKTGMMAWRGIYYDLVDQYLQDIPVELSGWKQRMALVKNYLNSSLIDAKFTETATYSNNNLNNDNDIQPTLPSEYKAARMDKKHLLRYKYLISLEADDVHSGLKWMLFSNSLVFSPPITYISWAMESMLEPFVHYVPIHANMSNVEEMIVWAENHPNKAKRIAERGTIFVYDLLFHPDAYREEEEVLMGIMERYEMLFGQRKNIGDIKKKKKEKEQ